MSIYRGRNNTEFYLASVLYDSIEDQNTSGVTKLITENGADANIVLPRKGISPFHLTIGSENLEFAYNISALILQHSGNPNLGSDDGLTPLHIAAAWGREELVSLLLRCGANADLKDNSYMTAADYAIIHGHPTIAEMIKEYINHDTFSFFSNMKDDKENYNLTFDKVLVNNGQTVGEYEVRKLESETGTIDLKVLPQTTPNEYVMNWCNTLETNNLILNDNSLNCSPEERDDSFQHITMARPKIFAASENVSYHQHPIKDFCKFSEKSRESGITTLGDSQIEDDDIIESTPSRKISVAKSKDTSSDYFTCTDISENVLEQNIFEASSTVSSRSTDLNQAQFLSSIDGDQSFVSVSEVYKYSDPQEGVVLYEKRVLPTQNCNPHETENCAASSTKSSKLSSLPRSFDYDTDTLRKELTNVGFEPGPITKTTKRVYLKKLYNLKKNPLDMNIIPESVKKVYSYEIQKTFRDLEWTADLTTYKVLEDALSKQFTSPDPSRKWREGVNKSSFTYLLLDPRVTQNLPCRADVLSQQEQWEIFLSSIFYVGKGKRSRPYQHLYEAVTLYNNHEQPKSKKLQHILDIWSENQGVICLHVFQNVIPVEAYTREAAMISALKLENLKNLKGGDFYGIAATWSSKQKRNLGVYLLYKAMRIFLNEGERQLSPSDID